MKTTAQKLIPGNIILKVGATTHRSITVTKVEIIARLVKVYGFTEINDIPRLMFRGLFVNLPVIIR